MRFSDNGQRQQQTKKFQRLFLILSSSTSEKIVSIIRFIFWGKTRRPRFEKFLVAPGKSFFFFFRQKLPRFWVQNYFIFSLETLCRVNWVIKKRSRQPPHHHHRRRRRLCLLLRLSVCLFVCSSLQPFANFKNKTFKSFTLLLRKVSVTILIVDTIERLSLSSLALVSLFFLCFYLFLFFAISSLSLSPSSCSSFKRCLLISSLSYLYRVEPPLKCKDGSVLLYPCQA